MTFDLSLSRFAGSRSLHRLVAPYFFSSSFSFSSGAPDDDRNSSRYTRNPSRFPTIVATTIESMKGQSRFVPTNIQAATTQAEETSPVVSRTCQSSGYIFIRLPFAKRVKRPNSELGESRVGEKSGRKAGWPAIQILEGIV